MANPTTLSKVESILFAAGRPLAVQKLAELAGVAAGEVAAALGQLRALYQSHGHGLELIVHQGEAALATHPDNSELVRQFLKREELGELTRPQLEALSVIAYRGPITKAELEQVRGVNCSLILRNLMIRGLVQLTDEEGAAPRYRVTVDFLSGLGFTSVEELPNYASLSHHANLEQFISAAHASPQG